LVRLENENVNTEIMPKNQIYVVLQGDVSVIMKNDR